MIPRYWTYTPIVMEVFKNIGNGCFAIIQYHYELQFDGFRDPRRVFANDIDETHRFSYMALDYCYSYYISHAHHIISAAFTTWRTSKLLKADIGRSNPSAECQDGDSTKRVYIRVFLYSLDSIPHKA